MPDELARRIAVASEGNVRRALLMLETCRVQQYGQSPRILCGVCAGPRPIRRRAPLPSPPPPAYGCDRYPFSETQPIEIPDWQRYIRDMAMNILSEQSPRRCDGRAARQGPMPQRCADAGAGDSGPVGPATE